jgi:hypothetical protein
MIITIIMVEFVMKMPVNEKKTVAIPKRKIMSKI